MRKIFLSLPLRRIVAKRAAGIPFSSFNVEFYSSNAGSLGVQLAIFTGAPTIVDQGFVNGYGNEVFQFTMDFAGFTADPGVSYFFSVSDSGPFNFVWATAISVRALSIRITARLDPAQ